MAMDLQRLMSLLRQCMQRYDMVSAGDKIAVGLSGGKDSLTLLMGLKHLQRFYPVPYGLCAIHVGSGAPGSEADVETMRRFCEELDVPFYFVDAKVYQIVFEIRKEKHPCSLCAKLRRGALNDKAMALGCNKNRVCAPSGRLHRNEPDEPNAGGALRLLSARDAP